MPTSVSDDLTTFPESETDDPDDVRWALETGKAMWQKGDQREALRWLRRAAETASEEGTDERALALAKAAADRRTELELPLSIAPPVRDSSPAAAAAGAAAPAPTGDAGGSSEAAVSPAEEPPDEPTQEWRAEELLAGGRRGASAARDSAPKPELATHHAVRVALTEPDDRGIFRGRRLKVGEQPPEGTTLAVLLAVEPDKPLFS